MSFPIIVQCSLFCLFSMPVSRFFQRKTFCIFMHFQTLFWWRSQSAQLTIWKCPFDVLKEALWGAHLGSLTSSFGPFDKTTPFLRVVNKNNKFKPPYFWKQKAKPLFLLTTAVLDIYSFSLRFLHIYSLFAWRKDQHLDACLRYMQNQSVGKHLTLQVVKASCLEVLGAYEEVEGATVEEMETPAVVLLDL